MKAFSLINRNIVRHITILGGLMVLFLSSGCKRMSPEQELEELANRSVVYAIKEAIKNPMWPDDVKERGALAISKWNNGVVDLKPIMINVSLGRAEGVEHIDISLSVYDEDKDFLDDGWRN